MFCVTCGCQNPNHGRFCHSCGKPLVGPPSQPVASRSAATSKPAAVRSEHDLFTELLQADQKPKECHRCGSKTDLTRTPFGIAKILSVKCDWRETASRAAVSAASIALAPVVGFGVLTWKKPGKSVSYNVLKVELVLCRSCLWEIESFWGGITLKDSEYRCHPWAEQARRLGYDAYLSADDLAKLKFEATTYLSHKR
jgi:hypothetical protein